jgi:hypothetical protein
VQRSAKSIATIIYTIIYTHVTIDKHSLVRGEDRIELRDFQRDVEQGATKHQIDQLPAPFVFDAADCPMEEDERVSGLSFARLLFIVYFRWRTYAFISCSLTMHYTIIAFVGIHHLSRCVRILLTLLFFPHLRFRNAPFVSARTRTATRCVVCTVAISFTSYALRNGCARRNTARCVCR